MCGRQNGSVSTDSNLLRPEDHSFRHQEQFVGWIVVLLTAGLVALVRLSVGA